MRLEGLSRQLRPLWREHRTQLLAGAAFLLFGGGLCFAGTPLWWFGLAIALSATTVLSRVLLPAAAGLRRRLLEPRRVLGLSFRPWTLALDVVYVSLLIFIGTAMMIEIVDGERPVSHDHTVHYFKAWQLHKYFLPEGRILGWSHRFFAGYPVNYLYPPGTDLWVNAVHFAGLGFFSFSESYANAFWLFHLFTGFAAYRLGRVVAGPHVGAIAGLLMLTDLSEFRLGGWAYTVEYGVWPQALSLNFALLAVCHIPKLVASRSAGGDAGASSQLPSMGWFSLWMGLAIVTHPAALIFLVILLLVVALAAAFADDVRAPAATFRLVIASALAFGVASSWLLPFFSSRAETYVMGVWWDTTYQIAQGLLDLDALPGTLPQVLAFGCVALLVMLRTRRFMLLFCSMTALFVPLVSSSTFVDEFHLPALSVSFTKIQFIRMSTMVKPFWFVLAGYFVVAVLTYARNLALDPTGPRPAESYTRVAMLSLLVSLLTVPFVIPAGEAFWTRHVRRSLTTESDRPLLEDRAPMVEWLKANLPDDEGFYRVGVFTGHNHDLLDLAAELDKPFYKRGFTPATNFIYKMKDQDRSLLEAVNLRYVLSKKNEPPQLFKLIKSFGIYKVYEFRYWNPKPFAVLDGAGDVTLERFSDEEIALRASPGSHGKLRLNVSYFSRWRAYRDGQPVPISATYLPEAPEETGFLTVPLAPGRYRFVFERSLLDRLAVAIGLSSVALAFAFVLAGRIRRLSWLTRALASVSAKIEVLGDVRYRGRRLFVLWLVLSGVLAAGAALALWTPPLPLRQQDQLPERSISRVHYDFLENLSHAHANIEYQNVNQPCLRMGDRHICRDAMGFLDNDRFVGSTPTNIEEYTMVRCVRARPETQALLSVSFPDVPMGQAIVGYYGVEREGRLMNRRRPVDFNVMVDGVTLYEGQTQSDNRMHWFKAPLGGVGRERATVVFSVKARNVRKRFFCFYAQVVDF